MRAAYNGHEALTFTDYLDLDTGKTLHAEPGGVYDIAPASGRVVPEVPEPWFALLEPLALEAAPADGETPEPAGGFTPEPEQPDNPEG